MTCGEFTAHLHAYVDGELGVRETAVADAHAADCRLCRGLVAAERQLRELVRLQPRESAPSALRTKIVRRVRRQAFGVVVSPALAAAAVGFLSLAGVLFTGWPRAEMPVVERLVDTHSAYAQLERPAEFASAAPAEVRGWLSRRAGLRVPIPDYSAAGIRLIGARVVAVAERRAGHVLYEKGHTLLSIFLVPLGARAATLDGSRIDYRGHRYLTQQRGGYRTVLWAEGPPGRQVVLGLVSMLDWDALLECADSLRAARGAERRF